MRRRPIPHLTSALRLPFRDPGLRHAHPTLVGRPARPRGNPTPNHPSERWTVRCCIVTGCGKGRVRGGGARGGRWQGEQRKGFTWAVEHSKFSVDQATSGTTAT